MTIDKILAEQDEWLRSAAKAIEAPDKSGVRIGMPVEIRKRRTEELKARIEALEAQKQAAAKRYDAAIDAEKAEIELLARDVAWDDAGPIAPKALSKTPVKAVSPTKRKTGKKRTPG